MFSTLIRTVVDFLPNLIWLLVAMLTGLVIHTIRLGEFNTGLLIHGLVVVVIAGVTTALWAGAVNNADS